MTIYDFVVQNRVEVTMNPDNSYSCYINYKPGDKPWGKGSNCLQAIDDAVVNYINSGTLPPPPLTAEQIQKENDAMRLFLSKDALFIWYFFARKYNMQNIINHYENIALNRNPHYLSSLRFLYTKVNEVIDDPTTKITPEYDAINNIFVQALVYYESLKMEKYNNNALIKGMISKLTKSDQIAFDKIQETIETVDNEIQKIPTEE